MAKKATIIITQCYNKNSKTPTTIPATAVETEVVTVNGVFTAIPRQDIVNPGLVQNMDGTTN